MRPPRAYFEKPTHPYQRRYEALRAHFFEGCSALEVARRFGYTPHSFEVLASRFLRDDLPPFFRDPLRGRQDRPVRQPLREAVLELRRQSLSVLDISERLTAQGRKVSPQTVWVILREAGSVASPDGPLTSGSVPRASLSRSPIREGSPSMRG